MAGSFSSGSGGGARPESVWQAVDRLAAEVERRLGMSPGAAREARQDDRVADVRVAIVAALAERPMHGSEVMAAIAAHSGGALAPTAGAVYPMLQQLVDEGLAAASETDGRRTYTLTDAGRVFAASAGEPAAGPSSDRPTDRAPFGALPRAGFELAQAAAAVRRQGSDEQVRQAVAALDDARRRIYAILAQS